MKKLVLGMFCFLSLSAYASEEIYNALKVEAIQRTELKSEKQVGGILCVKTRHTSHEEYTCDVDLDNFNSEQVYQALHVEEVPLAAARIELRYEKSSGNLTCLKIDNIRDGISYHCKLRL